MVVGVVGRHFPNVQQHVEEAYRQGQGHVPAHPLLMADNLVLTTRTALNIATHTAVQVSAIFINHIMYETQFYLWKIF